MSNSTHSIRPAAVAGLFYPGTETELRQEISQYLQSDSPCTHEFPKALIVPHAGYIYSGPIAGSAYKLLNDIRGQITRVILLGPAHTVPLRGLASPGVDLFQSPLGEVEIDCAGIAALESQFPLIQSNPIAHAEEHSLEVQLPFLQHILEAFTLIPLVVGETRPEELAEILKAAWGGPETLILISSDLSHFHSYAEARRLDQRTAIAIENFDMRGLGLDTACGRNAINGLLHLAREWNMQVERLDLRNSGDTQGPRDQVVGYGAWAFYES